MEVDMMESREVRRRSNRGGEEEDGREEKIERR